MPRTQLIVSYRGGAYVGWQRQTNGLGVQQVVEEALARLLDHRVRVTAAGRTDAGVHARGQSLHLDHAADLPPRALVEGGNRFLPDDVRLVAAERRDDGFHARFDAVAKEYRYRVSTAPVVDALSNWCTLRVAAEMDFERMNRAARQLVGEHDFAAFALAGGGHRSSVRRVLRAEWVRDAEKASFTIIGDGFLRGMVRAIVGTLLEIGVGSRSEDDLVRLLTGRVRSEAGATAPAHGLVLERVEYSAESGENGRRRGG